MYVSFSLYIYMYICICVCVYPSIRTTYAPSGAAAAPVRPRRANAPTHPRPRAEPGPRAFGRLPLYMLQ